MDTLTTVADTVTQLFSPPSTVKPMHDCNCGRGVVYGMLQGDQLVYLKQGIHEIKICSSCIDDKATESINIKIKKASLSEAQEVQVRSECNIPAGVSASQYIKDNQGRKLSNGKRIGDDSPWK